MSRTISLAASACLLALLGACATHEVDYQGEGEGVIGQGSPVQAVLETPSSPATIPPSSPRRRR